MSTGFDNEIFAEESNGFGMAEDISASFVNPKALIIGLGEMGIDVAKNFQNSEFSDITLCNRTDSKAKDLKLTFSELELTSKRLILHPENM